MTFLRIIRRRGAICNETTNIADRGYGRSQGKPTEQGILQDSQAALDWLLERTGLPTSGVVVWGRSLGGAAAVHLAARQPLKALLLDRTFSSLVEVAAAKFPWAPVRLLLRNRYPSQTKIASYRGPLLQIHGQIDRVVPYRFGRKLFDACPSNHKHFVDSATLDHNDAWDAAIFDRVQDFLTEVANADVEP